MSAGSARRDVSRPDFDALYASDRDPWQVETSWYERRKLAVLLAALPRERYATAWEPGCGPGVVSQSLAAHVGDLLASDVSATAVELARARPAMPRHVRFEVSQLPSVPVDRPVELVVVAEFLYYLPELEASLEALWSAAAPGGHVAFLHWAHQPHDAYYSGPEMHARIGLDAMQRDATPLVGHVDQDFLLDIYQVRS